MKPSTRKEFGDFQTPLELAREVCAIVKQTHGTFDHIIEPTCGLGAFVRAAAAEFPDAKIFGHEINHEHCDAARQLLATDKLDEKVSLHEQDFFAKDWRMDISAAKGRLLLLGNPPWVTNSEVSALGGGNVPVKNNFQGHSGMAARTGKANFDISEWMLIHLLEASLGRELTVAVLCKTATARKVLRHAWQKGWCITRATLHRIDAQKHFGASVDACLFMLRTGESGACEAMLHETIHSEKAAIRFGMVGKDLVADLDAYQHLAHLEGASPYRWRSGIKHDCASVMELVRISDGCFENGQGEKMELESNVVFPLLKSTALFHGRLKPERWMLVTQKRVGEPTQTLAKTAPKAWSYLQQHSKRFEARKSSIYRHGDAFALFGIGDYAFSDWKVAVSGLHRPTRFQVVAPYEGQPVLFDDTCYFLSFDSREQAEVVAATLNSKPCLDLISALALPEAKRPITVDLLHRLDLKKMAREAGLGEKWMACCTEVTSPKAESVSSQMEFTLDAAA